MSGTSFLFVEKLDDNGDWVAVASDADWETKWVKNTIINRIMNAGQEKHDPFMK